jgi:hypothetical protein
MGLRCVPRREWFVHERSIHPFDTGSNHGVPPEESFQGEADGADSPNPGVDGPVGLPHSRFWDLHVWLDEHDGVPNLSMLNTGELIPGIDPKVGQDFFYPPPLSGRS